MKRALALSISTLLLPMAAVATADAPEVPRYSVKAVSVPAPASRYQVSSDPGQTLPGAGRYRLLEADAAKAATGAGCEAADGLFANGFEN